MVKNEKREITYLSFPHHYGNQTSVVIAPNDIDKYLCLYPMPIKFLLHDSVVVLG